MLLLRLESLWRFFSLVGFDPDSFLALQLDWIGLRCLIFVSSCLLVDARLLVCLCGYVPLILSHATTLDQPKCNVPCERDCCCGGTLHAWCQASFRSLSCRVEERHEKTDFPRLAATHRERGREFVRSPVPDVCAVCLSRHSSVEGTNRNRRTLVPLPPEIGCCRF